MELHINDALIACVHAIFLALGLIIPLGIQNIFIFNQGSAQPSIKQALPSVITASLCDTIMILLAVFGVSLLILQIVWLKNIILGVGFIFLIYMGFVTWRQHPASLRIKQQPLSYKKQILFAISVSILNPHALIDTILVIGTSAATYSGYARLIFTSTCIAVSCLWFTGLAFAGHSLHKIDKSGFWLHAINKIAAIIIWLMACYIGFQLIKSIY